MKQALSIMVLTMIASPIRTVSLVNIPITIKAFPDLTLKDKKTFEMYKFKDEKWEFAVLPKKESNECYIRLGYWFDHEGLLQFELNENGEQGDHSSFILYVGPEHPLKLLDVRVPNKTKKGRFCSDEDYFSAGITSVMKYFNDRLDDEESLDKFIKMSISQGSINIAATLEDFPKLYEDIWSNVVDYKQDQIDKLMWKDDNFTQERYPPQYMTKLATNITTIFKRDFEQFFGRKQTEKAETLLNDPVVNMSYLLYGMMKN